MRLTIPLILLLIFPSEIVSQGHNIFLKAEKHFEERNYDEALRLYIEALGTSRSTSNAILELKSLLHISHIYARQRTFRKAEETLDLANKLLTATDTLSQIDYHFIRGLIHSQKFKFPGALTHLERSINFTKQNRSQYLILKARSLILTSQVYKDGYLQLDAAFDNCNEALSLLSSTNREREMLATANYQMARIHHSSRNLDQARHYNLKAQVYFQSNKAKYFQEFADCLHLEALIDYYQFGSTPKVLNKYRAAVNFLETSNRTSPLLGKYYDNFGYMLLDGADSIGAYQYFKKGLDYNLKLPFNEYWISSSLQNIGSFYLDRNQFDSAQFYLEKSLQYRISLFGENHGEVASALSHLGALFKKKGDLSTALKYFDKTIESYSEAQNKRNVHISPGFIMLVIYTYSERGDILKEKYIKENNIDLLEKAFQSLLVADSIADQHKKKDWESATISFNKGLRPIYNNLIQLAFQLNNVTGSTKYFQKAFIAIDKMKYYSLVERVANLNTSHKHKLLGQIKIAEEILNISNTGSKDSLQVRLLSLVKQLEEFEDSLQIANPNYLRHKRGTNSITIADFQKYLTSNDASFLHCYETDNSFYFLLITGSATIGHHIKKDPVLMSDINKFLDIIGKKPELKNTSFQSQQFSDISHRLFVQLLGTLSNHLKETERVAISSDGSLRYLPFELLVTRKAEHPNFRNMNYLLNETEIINAYSASALLTGNRTDTELNQSVLILNPQQKRESQYGGEVMAIKMRNSVYEIHGNSPKSQFLEIASKYATIHIPVHGMQNENDFLRSKLILPTEQGADTLYAFELYDQYIPADLVVLSSCESGQGLYYEGEGVFSFGRAFTMAGARSVITALWKIPDRQTAQLMSHFYEEYANSNAASSSLRAAKIMYIKENDEVLSHPYFWSGVIINESFYTDKESGFIPIHALGIISLLGIFLFFTWRIANNKLSGNKKSVTDDP